LASFTPYWNGGTKPSGASLAPERPGSRLIGQAIDRSFLMRQS
jgi:hypothetical protein